MDPIYSFSTLLLVAPLSAFFMLMAYWFWRLIRGFLPIEDVRSAYEVKRLKQEIEKKGIDFEEMMEEYNKFVKIDMSYKRKGTLNKIDARVEGELEEETDPKKNKKEGK